MVKGLEFIVQLRHLNCLNYADNLLFYFKTSKKSQVSTFIKFIHNTYYTFILYLMPNMLFIFLVSSHLHKLDYIGHVT